MTHAGTIYYTSENETDEKCLQTLKSIIHERDSENINNFDSRDVNRIGKLLTFKANSTGCGYFKNFIDIEQREDINIDLNGNDNDNNVLLIETLNLTEDNFSRVRVKSFILKILRASNRAVCFLRKNKTGL